MTAMMCFFLVMWLINAANEQTKAAVASYFNPVKLIDRNANRKGLEDLGDGPIRVGMTADNPQEPNARPARTAGQRRLRRASNKANSGRRSRTTPTRICLPTLMPCWRRSSPTPASMQNISEKAMAARRPPARRPALRAAKSYRDPFAPDFWSQQVATPGAEASAERARIEGDPAKPGDKVADSQNRKRSRPEQAGRRKRRAPRSATPQSRRSRGDRAQGGSTAKAEAKSGAAQARERHAEKAAAQGRGRRAIRARTCHQAIRQAGDKLGEGLTVVGHRQGRHHLDHRPARFRHVRDRLGRAAPRPGAGDGEDRPRSINGQKGKLTINGHTDARPFRSDTYDNWRLSTARAHSAYYMLVRGGVDERRITEVAGFADRQPKDPADPLPPPTGASRSFWRRG